MTEPGFSNLASFHTLGDDPIPDGVLRLAGDATRELVWRNELAIHGVPVDDVPAGWTDAVRVGRRPASIEPARRCSIPSSSMAMPARRTP